MRWWSPWPRSNLIKARPIPNSLPDRDFAKKARALEVGQRLTIGLRRSNLVMMSSLGSCRRFRAVSSA